MSTRQDSECERIWELLPDFAVGRGSARARASIQCHLDSCPACAREVRALERTSELLNRTPAEPAPDLWDAIRPNLATRKAPAGAGRLRWWFARHRLQSAIAGMAAAIAIAALLVTSPQTPPEVEAQTYFSGHAAMSWREPFADKAGLGLAGFAPVEGQTEHVE